MVGNDVLDARVGELERRFGDPFAGENPVGFAAVVDADERAEMCRAGERVLDEYGLNAEFVPAALGGRLTRLDHLIEVMRAVYRRDPCLGLGYGASSFIAAVNVWAAAGDQQRRTVADLLLSNRKVACAYHELARGNDMARTELTALPGTGGLVLNGRKEVVTNMARADAVVLFARTDPKPGSRSHSQVLVDKAALPPDRFRYLPRFHSSGMRGVQLGGMEFRDCPVGPDSVLGTTGHGLETALKSFQLTRIALPGMMTGALDTGLRTAVRHAVDRRLYGRAAIDLPYVRAVLTNAFADLLMCECFAAVTARAVHVLPGETSVYAAAAKYAISGAVLDAMNQLSVVLGAEFYRRDGQHAIFQKLLRDARPVGFGHAARAACQMTILPQLPLLARRSWGSTPAPPAALFDLEASLPPLPYTGLSVSGAGRDHLSSALAAILDEPTPGDPEHRMVNHRAAAFRSGLRELAAHCAGLPVTELAATASSEAYDLATGYVHVLVASACLGVWRYQAGGTDPFLGDPAWLLAVLHRLPVRPSAGPRRPLPKYLEERLFAELLDRYHSGHTLGLTRRQLPGWR
jgi:alkylation response protein AidB-like acyl-CoA dehydrogenase